MAIGNRSVGGELGDDEERRGYLQKTRKGLRSIGSTGAGVAARHGSKMREIGKGEISDAPAASQRIRVKEKSDMDEGRRRGCKERALTTRGGLGR